MKNIGIWILVAFGIGLCGLAASSDAPCAARWQDQGQGYVCVCNSSYCDTVEPPVRLLKGYYWYRTSNSTPGFSKSTGKFTRKKAAITEDIMFTINSSAEYQEIIGFGGAVTDTTCFNKISLPKEAQAKLMESYFGPNGIEYNLLRVPIGGTDFSNRSYTLDDVPGDDNLDYFSLAEEDFNLKIPFIKEAMNMSQRNIKLMACAWSAPSWMKSLSNAPTYVKPNQSEVWARYHLKFLEEYRKEDLHFWSISGSNEGMLAIMVPGIGSSNTTVVFAHGQRQWFKNALKPILKASNFSDIKFLAMEDQNLFAKYWLDRFALDKEAYSQVDGIALHWYTDYFLPTSKVLDKIHNAYPDKLIMYTESSCNGVCGQEAVVLGSWYRGETYVYDILRNLNHWSSSFIDWNLALDLNGGPTIDYGIEAAVIVNETSGEFYKQPIFYAMGHFSKFVQPGSRRVNVTYSYINKTSVDDESEPDLINKLQTSSGRLRLMAPYNITFQVPQLVDCFAASNPDGSFTVIVVNTDEGNRSSAETVSRVKVGALKDNNSVTNAIEFSVSYNKGATPAQPIGRTMLSL